MCKKFCYHFSFSFLVMKVRRWMQSDIGHRRNDFSTILWERRRIHHFHSTNVSSNDGWVSTSIEICWHQNQSLYIEFRCYKIRIAELLLSRWRIMSTRRFTGLISLCWNADCYFCATLLQRYLIDISIDCHHFSFIYDYCHHLKSDLISEKND